MSGNGAFIAALLDADQAPPAGLRASNGADPAQRFNVHRNNVLASLIEALASTYPVTRALVGEDFFRAMARAHVLQSPPSSPLLIDYGAGFPDFIAGFSPADGLPYLPDMARLEWLRVQAYHAADAVPLDAGAFQPLLATPERLFALRVELHPACRCLRSTHAVLSLWTAHQGQVAIESVDLDRAEDTLVFRSAQEVRVLALPPGGAEFLEALANRRTLAEAAALAGNDAGFDLTANLRGLVEHGLASAFCDSV